MPRYPFYKLHGAGNDFVFLDARMLPDLITPDRAVALCRRHFGIGADGVLVWYSVEEGLPGMRIFNSDGSLAEMCGNGLRCFAKVLVDHFSFDPDVLRIVTDAGVKTCRLRETNGQTRVRVSMGPVTRCDGSPLGGGEPDSAPLHFEGRTLLCHKVSTGNPHAILWGPFEEDFMQRAGPVLTRDSLFPKGANIEFVTVRSREALDVVVHERGAGFTLACGTGAVASAACAVASGRCEAEHPLRVRLPGGVLMVTVARDFSNALLEGPAVEVYRGTIEIR